MKARELINDSGIIFGPDALKVVGKAFDDAWSEIASHFAKNGLEAQSARLRLARAVLAAANENSHDPVQIKNFALRIMAQRYRYPTDPSDSDPSVA